MDRGMAVVLPILAIGLTLIAVGLMAMILKGIWGVLIHG